MRIGRFAFMARLQTQPEKSSRKRLTSFPASAKTAPMISRLAQFQPSDRVQHFAQCLLYSVRMRASKTLPRCIATNKFRQPPLDLRPTPFHNNPMSKETPEGAEFQLI
jgi:hypothetical protein